MSEQALILARILGHRINMENIQVCLAFFTFYFSVPPFLYLAYFPPMLIIYMHFTD